MRRKEGVLALGGRPVMSRRIGWLVLVPLLGLSACASIWNFEDFEPADAASDSAASDSTVPDAVQDDVQADDHRALAEADSSATDAGIDAVGHPAADADASVDAFDAFPNPAPDASCTGPCPTGAICDNGMCVCSSAPNICPTACVDFQTDPSHCGSCTVACPLGASCVASACTCPPAQPSGCASGCVDTETDHDNCGGCGNACPSSSACHAGMCTICGTFVSDKTCSGNCVDVASDVKNCGSCGHACASGSTCAGGVCTCPPGDPTTCAAAPSDAGICVDTSTDHNNCGGCGNVCRLANARSGCTDKTCVILSCNTGFSDCDKAASNGCEIDTANDTNNCNECGNACRLPNALPGCGNSSCYVKTCVAGYANCDGLASNGCEIDTQTDSKNCGACSTDGAPHACTGGKVCVNAVCDCPAGMHDCTGTCVSDDSTSTSSCGTTCAPCTVPTHGTATCSGAPPVCGGACGNAVYPTLCGRACVDVMDDNGNCGGCGATFACASGETCVAGVCMSGTDAGGKDAATANDAATPSDAASANEAAAGGDATGE